MCPVHQGGRVFGCKYCMNAISTLQFIDSAQDEAITTYEGFRPPLKLSKPPTVEAPAPKPEPKAPLDPMILLADMADVIDMAQRKFRIMMWELALVFIVASVAMSVMMVGLFFSAPLFWVGLPFTIGGVGCLPSTIAAAQKRYLAIWEARAEFAKTQRRVGP